MLYSSDAFLYKQPAKNRTATSERSRIQDPGSERSCTINELILADSPWQSDFILTPILNQLSERSEARWLTLVLAEKEAGKTRQWLKKSGINNRKIQIINPRCNTELVELTRKALASGTSHTVISWLNDDLAMDNLEALEQAARNGHCQGLAIRNRSNAA